MSEYIGSRISLISKSDIKYIGTLHEINSDSHTVALESVTSYGTEGRKGNPDEEIPGSDQVYEYIVFRGSDVKELTIVAPPAAPKENERPKVPDDPAILGSARPPPQGPQQPAPPQFRGPQPPYQPQPQFGFQGPPPNQFQGQPRFQGPGGPHGFPGTPGAVPGYGYGPPPPGYYGPPPGQGFPQPPPGPFNHAPHMPGGPPGPPIQQHGPPSQMGTRSPHPPAGSNQPTPQPGGQISQPPNQPAHPAGGPATAAPGPANTSDAPQVAAAKGAAKPQVPQSAAARSAQKMSQRVAVPLPPPSTLAAKPPQKPAAAAKPSGPVPTSSAQPQSTEDATQAATAAVAAAMAKLGTGGQTRVQGEGVDNLTQKVNQMRVQESQHPRGRGRGRGAVPRGGRHEGGTRPVEVPKEDFDFESSNAKFNKQDLIKEAIASGSPITSPTTAEKADPLAATNGHTNGDAAEDIVIPPQAKIEKGYDKKSSFFDDISSDLKDRVEQAQQQEAFDGRTMRREERTKNVETFGQGSVDTGYRGGFRGRGRGRGFPRGGYRGRGGYDQPRGDFRGRGSAEAI